MNQSWARDIFDGSIFYKVRIIFDRFVEDIDVDTNRLALAQATSYTIMDYFNQYTYAEVSANMIAEIAYTETITFWSTLIAAPLIYFGSGLIGGVTGVATEATAMTVRKFIEQVVKAPIKEVFDEIIKDSAIETLVEWAVDLVGLPEDLAFWISSYLTSGRESKGALGDLAGLNLNQDTGGISPNILSQISLIQGLTSGDSEITNAIVQEFNQQQQQIQQDHDQSSFWKKLLQTNMLKGAFMTLSSAFLGSFGFIGLMGLGDMVTSSIKLAPQAYAEFKTKQHAKRKAEIDRAIGTGTEFSSQNMMHGLIKSTELENANIELNNEYDEQSGDPIPHLSYSIHLNPDPRIETRNELVKSFQQVRLISTLLAETRSYQEQIQIQSKQRLQQAEINIATAQDFRGFFNRRLSNIKDSYSFLELQILDRQMDLLSRIEYEGYTVYDKAAGAFGGINYHVLEAICLKNDAHETLTELEDLILGFGAFIMGGPSIDQISFNPDNSDLKYPLNDNDDPSTELLKTMFNIIHKYKDRIALYTDLDYREDGSITLENMGNIFSLGASSVYNYLSILEDTKINPATYNIPKSMYIKLEASVSRFLDISQLNEIKILMEGAFKIFALKEWGEIPFNVRLMSIFSTYAAPIGKEDYTIFSGEVLSKALGRVLNYIHTKKEKTDSFFRLITLINLIDETKVRPYREDSLSKIKEDSINLVFEEMVNLKLIHSENLRPLFDLTSQMLTTLTIATKPRSVNDRQEVYSLNDLSSIASKGNSRKFLTRKFQHGYSLQPKQGERIKAELRKNYFTSAKELIDETLIVTKEFFRKHEAEYHRYFKFDLYVPQVYEVISITLGIDPFSQNFIEDAEPSPRSGKFNIDVVRHHPYENKEAYTIFDSILLGTLLNIIPISRSSHGALGVYLRNGLNIENQLTVARFLHLYELIQRPYEAGKDYFAEFLNEFNSKTTILYEGNEMSSRKLWDYFDQEKIKTYVDRWLDMKEDLSESIFDNNKFFSKHYSKWYFNTFKPYMEDYNYFLQQSPLTKRPDFWYWYLNTYLRDDFHPFYVDSFS